MLVIRHARISFHFSPIAGRSAPIAGPLRLSLLPGSPGKRRPYSVSAGMQAGRKAGCFLKATHRGDNQCGERRRNLLGRKAGSGARCAPPRYSSHRPRIRAAREAGIRLHARRSAEIEGSGCQNPLPSPEINGALSHTDCVGRRGTNRAPRRSCEWK